MTATLEPTVTATLSQPRRPLWSQRRRQHLPTRQPLQSQRRQPFRTNGDSHSRTNGDSYPGTNSHYHKPTSEPTAVAKGTATKPAPIAINCNLNPGIDRGSTYVVGLCDWLAKIATKLGVSYQALLAANPQIEDPNLIYPGQILNVPPRSGQGQSRRLPAGQTIKVRAVDHTGQRQGEIFGPDPKMGEEKLQKYKQKALCHKT